MSKFGTFRGFVYLMLTTVQNKEMQVTLFSSDSYYTPKWYNFKNTELGRIHGCIDWDGLEGLLPQKTTLCGAPSWLSKRGFFGLMFLKHYTGLSDEKLLARFNTDWAMQLFCGTLLPDNEAIRDNAFVSKVRKYLGTHVEMQQVQKVLISAWKKEIPDQNVLLMDATCYEVHLRFPTDIKIIWESCRWLWEKQIRTLCKVHGVRQPRSKYKDQKSKTLVYSKLRKNRRFVTKEKIVTNFVRKGKGKDHKPSKQIKALLNKERSTRLEGSFGNEKENYSLRKIKARIPETELVWLYFGVLTANCVLIAKRRQKQQFQIAA